MSRIIEEVLRFSYHRLNWLVMFIYCAIYTLISYASGSLFTHPFILNLSLDQILDLIYYMLMVFIVSGFLRAEDILSRFFSTLIVYSVFLCIILSVEFFNLSYLSITIIYIVLVTYASIRKRRAVVFIALLLYPVLGWKMNQYKVENTSGGREA